MTTRNGKAAANGRYDNVVPPHEADSERSLLGCVLAEPELLSQIAEWLKADDFYLTACARIFAELVVMLRDGVPIEAATLINRLTDCKAIPDVVTHTDLQEIGESFTTAANWQWYLDRVRLKAEQRRALLMGQNLMRIALDDYNAAENYTRWRGEIEGVGSVVFREASKPNGPQIITAEELMKRVFPDQKWVVKDIFIEGLNLLAGKPKFGKSWLMLALAIAVALGGMFLGKIPVEIGDVLLLALEDNDRRLKKRLEILLAGSDAPARLYRATQWKRSNEGGIDDLRSWLVAHPEARLVIIDTLKRFKPKTTAKANAYDSDYEAMIPLQSLAAEFGVCIVVVHHTNRGKKDDILDSVNGSNGLAGGADSILVAQKERGKVDGLLFLTGRDVEEKTLALKWDALTCNWLLVGEVDGDQLGIRPERQAIIDILAQHAPFCPRPAEVAFALGKTSPQEKNAVRALMLKMEKDDQIVNDGTGRYTVALNTTIHSVHSNNGDHSHSSAVSDHSSANGVNVDNKENNDIGVNDVVREEPADVGW